MIRIIIYNDKKFNKSTNVNQCHKIRIISLSLNVVEKLHKKSNELFEKKIMGHISIYVFIINIDYNIKDLLIIISVLSKNLKFKIYQCSENWSYLVSHLFATNIVQVILVNNFELNLKNYLF